jgi:hypothetical protein
MPGMDDGAAERWSDLACAGDEHAGDYYRNPYARLIG